MRDVKKWLNTIGLPVAELRFLKRREPPYVIFRDSGNTAGPDMAPLIYQRTIGLELYVLTIDHKSERAIEALLNAEAIEFEKNRTWIEQEKLYETTYDFTIIDDMEVNNG